MSIFKRLSTSLFAQIDEVVGEIENHDALIKAAINEQRKKIATAKVHLNKIQGNEKKVANQITKLKLDEQRWAERATREAKDNETQALACLQRRQKIREQMARLTDAADSYHNAAKKMEADINRCEHELRAMTQKHELLRARQSSSDALNVINEICDSNIDDLETSFERWEIKIAQNEFNVESYDSVDILEENYLVQENEAELRAQLAELLEQEKDDDNS